MNTDKIRQLNDEFRKDLTKGKCVMTSGISALCGFKPERITSLVNTVSMTLMKTMIHSKNMILDH
mgnify:CR=1 FL=1